MSTRTEPLPTRTVHARDLEAGDILVGDLGGLLAVTGYVEPSNIISGTHRIETELGVLHHEPGYELLVLDGEAPEPAGAETRWVHVTDLGPHTLVGDRGGCSHITGDADESNLMTGFFLVETEHGTSFVPDDTEVQVLAD